MLITTRVNLRVQFNLEIPKKCTFKSVNFYNIIIEKL